MKTLEKIDEVLNNPYICLCNDLTKKFERKYYGYTKDVIKELEDNENHELGEYVIIVSKNKKENKKEDILMNEKILLVTHVFKNIRYRTIQYKTKCIKSLGCYGFSFFHSV